MAGLEPVANSDTALSEKLPSLPEKVPVEKASELGTAWLGRLRRSRDAKVFLYPYEKNSPHLAGGPLDLVGRLLALDLMTPSRWAGSRLRRLSSRACALDVARSPHVAR